MEKKKIIEVKTWREASYSGIYLNIPMLKNICLCIRPSPLLVNDWGKSKGTKCKHTHIHKYKHVQTGTSSSRGKRIRSSSNSRIIVVVRAVLVKKSSSSRSSIISNKAYTKRFERE